MMRHLVAAACCCLLVPACSSDDTPLPFIADARSDAGCDWMQWGQNWAHTGRPCAPARRRPGAGPGGDPFLDREIAETDGLFGQTACSPTTQPARQGDDVYIARQAGDFRACSPPGSQEPALRLRRLGHAGLTVQHHRNAGVWRSERSKRLETADLAVVVDGSRSSSGDLQIRGSTSPAPAGGPLDRSLLRSGSTLLQLRRQPLPPARWWSTPTARSSTT
jgi:hypothetical protein